MGLQENPFDCGVFVLEYFIYLLRCPAAFAKLGLESHQEWFDQSVVTHRRQRMRDIVEILRREGQRVGDGDILALLRNEDIRLAVKKALIDEPVGHTRAPASSPTAPLATTTQGQPNAV